MTTIEERLEKGYAMRREIWGDDGAESRNRPGNPLADYNQLIDEVMYGVFWSRPGLDTRTRSMITMAMLAVLGRDALRNHIRGALHLGITEDQIREVLIHSSLYGGVPAARAGLAIAQEVFKEAEERAGAPRP